MKWPLRSASDDALENAAKRFQLDHPAKLAHVKMLITQVERALDLEQVPPETKRRVINTLLWGHPDGEAAYEVVADIDRRERERSERMVVTVTDPQRCRELREKLGFPALDEERPRLD